jgi:hypothetical protein
MSEHAIPEIQRAQRCGGCAFRPRTEANQSPLTLMKAKLCAMTSDPFLCHEARADGIDALCAGWVAQMTVLLRSGYYESLTNEQRAFHRACLAAIVKLEDKMLAGEDINDVDVPAEVLTLLEAQP